MIGERALRLAGFVALVAIALIGAASARAQVSAAAPAGEGGGPGHGWVALPGDDDGHALWHLPPRLSSAQASGATSGTLRVAVRLTDRPEQMAAWGRDVWLISSSLRAGRDESLLRRVHRLSVRPNPVGEGWLYVEGGRLRAEPPLAGGDRLIHAAGSDAGPCALTRAPGAPARLWRLGLTGWAELELPEAVAEAPEGAALGLVSLPSGVGVWMQEAGSLAMWRGVEAPATAPALAGAEAEAPQGPPGASGPAGEQAAEQAAPAPEPVEAAALPMQWTLRPLAGAVDTSAEAKLWSVSGRIVTTEWAGRKALRVRDLSGQRPALLAEMEGVDPAAAVCALDGSRRVAIVWRELEGGGEAGGAEGASRPLGNPLRIIEISTDDGSVMYDGEAQSPGPVSPAEFKLLALALVAISAGALVFIVRTDDGRRPIALPDATALAPARLRVVAGIVDGSIAWIIGSGLAESAAAGWLAIDLGGVALDFAPLLATLAVGWALGSLTEWLTGRSPGKWMAGCAVVSVRPGDQRPGLMRAPRLWQAAARNFVKYPLAPIAMLGLATPELRHRGDALSWTAVVIPVGEEARNDE